MHNIIFFQKKTLGFAVLLLSSVTGGCSQSDGTPPASLGASTPATDVVFTSGNTKFVGAPALMTASPTDTKQVVEFTLRAQDGRTLQVMAYMPKQTAEADLQVGVPGVGMAPGHAHVVISGTTLVGSLHLNLHGNALDGSLDTPDLKGKISGKLNTTCLMPTTAPGPGSGGAGAGEGTVEWVSDPAGTTEFCKKVYASIGKSTTP